MDWKQVVQQRQVASYSKKSSGILKYVQSADFLLVGEPSASPEELYCS